MSEHDKTMMLRAHLAALAVFSLVAVLIGLVGPFYYFYSLGDGRSLAVSFNIAVIVPLLTFGAIVFGTWMINRGSWVFASSLLVVFSLALAVLCSYQLYLFDTHLLVGVLFGHTWLALLAAGLLATALFVSAIGLVPWRPIGPLRRGALLCGTLLMFIGAAHGFQFTPMLVKAGYHTYKFPRMESSMLVGREAPDMIVTDLQDNQHRLSEHRGKVVVLNFWATWCGPCISEMPSLQALYQRTNADRSVFWAISIDRDTSLVRPFVGSTQYGVPVMFGTRGISIDYGVRFIPVTVIIDTSGIVHDVITGYAPAFAIERIESTLHTLLNEG